MVEIRRRSEVNEGGQKIPYLQTNPELKSYMQKYIEEVKSYHPSKKIDLLYKLIVKKDPQNNLNLDRKLNRILYEYEVSEKVRETEKELKKNKKKFKFNLKMRKDMKNSLKKQDHILVLFYTITGDILGPQLYPIFDGNMVFIKSKPYEVDPRAVWRLGKYKCTSIREIDRRPISNLDLDEIKKRGDATDSDEFLIKAAMRAYTSGASALKKSTNWWILLVIGAAIVAFIIFLFSSGA